MEKFFKTLLLFFFLFTLSPLEVFCGSGKSDISSDYDWNRVMNAIIIVESEGKSDAHSGNSVGAMQITPILVAECNNILRSRRSRKRFKLSDRLSPQKSKEMFLLFQSRYNPRNSVEWAIRSWNGGIHYSVNRTQRYFEKVMSLLK